MAANYGLPYVPYVDLHERAVTLNMPFDAYMDGLRNGDITINIQQASPDPPRQWKSSGASEKGDDEAAEGGICACLVSFFNRLCCVPRAGRYW